MLSKFDPLYDILDTFAFHERRFQKPSLKYHVDLACAENFVSFTPFLPEGSWHTDLLVRTAVEYMLQARHCPRFLQTVYHHTPQDIATTHYRQEGVRELVEKPDLARRIEDALNTLSPVGPKLKERDQELQECIDKYSTVPFASWRGQVLKPITPYNLKLLALYVRAVEGLAETLKEAESRPLQRAYRFLAEEVIETDFFRDIKPVFEISYFKDDRVSLDATLARDGSYRAAIVHRRADENLLKDAGRALARVPARVWGFLHTFQFPSTYAMDATNKLVDFHRLELLRPSHVIGSLEFYTCQAAFHRRMQEVGEEAHIPQVLPKEERRLHLPHARNPVLMYTKSPNRQVAPSGRKTVGNDINYEPDQNLAIITGPNQAGKSVYIRTTGLLVVQALQGGALPIGPGGYVSVVDGIHTHFSGEDDMAKGEGTFLQELHRYREKVFRMVTPFSLALLDEPTTGTDTEGSLAVLNRILTTHHYIGTPTFVTTHQHRIGDLVEDGTLSGGYTLCPELKIDPATGKNIKTFKIVPGRSFTSLAEEVAELAGLSPSDMNRLIFDRVSAGQLDPTLFRK